MPRVHIVDKMFERCLKISAARRLGTLSKENLSINYKHGDMVICNHKELYHNQQGKVIGILDRGKSYDKVCLVYIPNLSFMDVIIWGENVLALDTKYFTKV